MNGRGERVVLRFKRAIKFPEFSMSENETWLCYGIGGTGKNYLEAVESKSDRFEFAGGQCFIRDVERVA